MLKTAPHKESAVKFLEYLAGDDAQRYFADGNNEWPAVASVVVKNPALDAMGKFKADNCRWRRWRKMPPPPSASTTAPAGSKGEDPSGALHRGRDFRCAVSPAPTFRPASHGDQSIPRQTQECLYSANLVPQDQESRMAKPEIAAKSPFAVNVEQGKDYWWCSCGKSKSQPFCDGSHKGSEFNPVKYTAGESKAVYFCGCKHSGNGALCDGSHKSL
jgi:CDGSH-type Zn-finger protein